MTKSDIVAREKGLLRDLSQGQLTMIALGSAIGTGLFLGSGFAVSLAGPAVILSYVVAAIVALIMMGCLSEMAVAHPAAGSFGAYAEMYIGPFAGWSVRYTYWACQVIAVGGEVVAAAIYMQYWFPNTPSWIWMVAFAALMVYINASSVSNFGTFEYWFSMIKVSAIVFFIITGVAVVFGIGTEPIGVANLTKEGGFFPKGLSGVWMGVVMAIFSFIGVEVVAVTSGEAKHPEVAIPKAMRTMVLRLIIFYLFSLTIMLCVVPWTQAGGKVSPFVQVFSAVGIPYAAGIMNFVVLTAALSSMNANLYLTSRMMFSLARGNYAPRVLGKLSKRGTPVNALLASTGGIALAVLLQTLGNESAYLYTFGIALFGALFVWSMIIVTFFRFRASRIREGAKPLPTRMPLHPVLPGIGLVLLVSIMVTFYFHEFFRVGVYSGIGWLILMYISYLAFGRRNYAATDKQVLIDTNNA
ncbi:amino acid permease-associated region [Desulfotomaculum nigrificans CO-1-SRB]|uniref:Amino acid permease-associated region n=1 Tax=Desulfotomaculum nigrificans (strain DSM 14880 / VKM B-2319 / CO-1-SRB) TaxID=868595 RepID=F6B9F4_DESCC|nr:amino acid permease [Desulfotomaculum nigrificans]AEF93730.1 amino acid permease-associated region [Desulfotomaculum nigrificans CO-1-SRB]